MGDDTRTRTGTTPAPSLDRAMALFRAGHLDALTEAERICHALLRTRPGDPDTLHLLGRIAHRLGRFTIAAMILSKAAALRPDDASFHYALASALNDAGQREAALRGFRRTLELEPDMAKAHTGLAQTLAGLNEHDQAIESFRRALELNPESARAYHGLGAALLHQAEREASVESFRRAVALVPYFADAHAGVLFASHYLPVDRAGLAAEARAWGERHADPLTREAAPHPNNPDPERRLRIGYVSADFHSHPVGYFLEAALAAHDRGSVEVFCYSNGLRVDATTERLKAAADHWRIIWGMMDEAAAELIRKDEIDVLIDLAGHTAGNRLMLFARKPAPVQASWLGYFDTTGMRAMDHLIADPNVCPPGDDSYYVERVYRLPGDFLCYTPPQTRVEVSPPPALTAGHVTFGCFNNIAKVTPQVVAVWAQILEATPGSRLRLKSAALKSPGVRERFEALFAASGVVPERLTLDGPSRHAEYLASYGEIDVALDPFPYNGGTTTVEALWMGVPVVALEGDRFVSRMGLSHLTAVGLRDLVAPTEAEYVARAVSLASDTGRLEALRSRLRRDVETSPLCDSACFTRQLEHAFRTMWRSWCADRTAPPTAAVV